MRRVLLSAVVGFASTTFAHAQAINIELNNTPTADDDYICWTPHRARIRLETPQADDVTVRLSGTQTPGAGQVAFGLQGASAPTAADWQPADTIELTLSGSGAWSPFLVSGTTASSNGKDVKITATETAAGAELGDVDVMVRVRKNADLLSAGERQRLLGALATLNGHNQPGGPTEGMRKYALAHGAAFNHGIHDGNLGHPLFLAWHRAFILSLERELQAIDASVTIPYWRFDQPSSNIFTADFMGEVTGGSALVVFAGPTTNPLSGWRMSDMARLVRGSLAQRAEQALQTVFPPDQFMALADILGEPDIKFYGGADPIDGANSRLEEVHHNYAHGALGGGPIISGQSPRDPIFFLLHANVDRAFAEWQALFNRYDATQIDSYSYQGSFSNPGTPSPVGTTIRYGSYALDPMWPWTQTDGSSTPGSDDNWPSTGFPFINVPGFGPIDVPTPASMIDYMNVLGNTEAIGACYDDLKYVVSE